MSQSSTELTVNGAVATPLAETAADLASLVQTSVTIDVAGTAEVFSGPSVHTLLQQSTFEAGAGKNGDLRDTVQVTDSAGGQVVLSEGEVDPNFGGATATDIIATSENGTALAAPMLIVPGDANGGIGGRDLTGVTTLTVGEATVPAVTNTAVPTTSFTLTGAVANPGTYTVAGIEALRPVIQTDTFEAGATPETFTFTGTTLLNLITTAGLSPAAQANLLDDYVIVTGSDGYATVYSLGELADHQGQVALLAIDDGTGTFPSISGNAGDFRSTAPGDLKGGRYVSNVENVEVVVACFRTGTRIATRDGAIPVERLQVGQRVNTRDGTRPITWIGHRRLDPSRHPRPAQILPVRVAAGAFGPHLPARDLYLSPDHAIFWDGVLIPIRHLLNGTTVAQATGLEPFTYWHVELDRHAVLLAEGLAAESYLATDDRRAFDNAGAVVTLHPGEASRIWDAEGCAPLAVTGPAVERLRAWLSEWEGEAGKARFYTSAV
jgi:hypothetical protein